MKAFYLLCSTLFVLNISNYPQWTEIPIGTSANLIGLHFTSVNTGWVVGTNGTILKTSNGGNWWTVQQSNLNIDFASVYFIDSLKGWACGVYGNIIKTTNGGTTWVQKPSGVTENINSIIFVNQSDGFAVTSDWYSGFPYSGRILKTNNGGESWTINLFDDSHGFIDLFFLDQNNGWVCGSNGATYKTTNGGNTWNYINANTGYWLFDIFYSSQNIGYLVGGNSNSDFISKSTNSGNTWNQIRESFQDQAMIGAYFINDLEGWVCGFNGVMLKTTNGGISWNRETLQTDKELREIFFIDSVGYCVGFSGTFMKYNFSQPTSNIQITSPNGGELWEIGSTKQITWNSTEINYVNIEYSYNNGLSWNTVVLSYPNSNVYNWTVPNILSDNCLVRIGDYPSSYDVSDNSFSIVEPVPVELTSFSSEVVGNDVTLHWTTATETNNSEFNVQRSVISGEGKNFEWLTLGIVNGNGTTTEPQIYSFVDENISAGIFQYRLKQIDYNGAFEYSNSIEVEINPPTKFSLEQNYPNPFNPSTTIQFNIAKDSYVSLKVYNINGEEISSLIEGYKQAGTYSLNFEPNNLPSGIYLYRIVTEDFSAVQKMTYLK